MKGQYDFVAIGDTATDAFIRIKEAEVHCKNDSEEDCEICMPFKDKVPYEDSIVVPAVGNSANASVAAARLGLKSALVSHLGNDHYGKEAVLALEEEGVSTEFVELHSGKKTNYHYVLWYGDDRTILIKHEQYPYTLPDIGSPKWMYVSSLGEHAADFHAAIADYLEAHPEVKLSFQPGTYQIKMGKDALARIYARAELFFCNKEEAERILGAGETDIKELLRAMRELGPKAVVITDGPAGAYVYDGAVMLMTTRYPDPKPPLERTGAGDAFSSAFTAAVALGHDVREALRWAPVNAMSVVQKVGARAGLLRREELEGFLKHAPAEYIQKEI